VPLEHGRAGTGSPSGPTTAAPDPAGLLARLADGYLTTQLLFVAAELGVVDVLVEGPMPATEIAAAVGAEAGPLHRVLRGLAAEQVLDELPDGRFALTAAGALLAADVPGSQRGTVLARGRIYYAALAGLLDAVRTGGTPFELVHGEPFFTRLAANPDEYALFQASMSGRSAREAAAVVEAYDFGRFRRLVDVGGGRGILLRAILDANPGLDGLLFDRPEVVGTAALPSAGGDFFAAVPDGADAYLLSRVLHDWDDAEALAILRACRRATADDATLLVVEAVLPPRAADDPAAVRMDLHMLALLHGRERSEAEFRALLATAGFRLVRTLPTGAGVHVLEAVPSGPADDAP
jgi:O-methyltransferase domain/Dimerisation domain